MGERPVRRRLAAVIAADVVGYTQLMERDSEGTVAAWLAAREGVIKPRITAYAGSLIKLTGDGFLAEFSTVQDAVNCAIAMQDELATGSLDFRMGINLGDLIDDGEDIHGEGVNIAARIEALADAGGINVSGSVYDQVRNRVDAAYEDRGEHFVKNVSAPVRVYAIGPNGQSRRDDGPLALIAADGEGSLLETARVMEGNTPPTGVLTDAAGQTNGVWNRRLSIAGILILALAAAFGGWLYQYSDKGTDFAKMTLHGQSSASGEPFVFLIEVDGAAELRIGTGARERNDIGRWWADEAGNFCFQFANFFARRQTRCVSPYLRGDELVARPPRGNMKPWIFKQD